MARADGSRAGDRNLCGVCESRVGVGRFYWPGCHGLIVCSACVQWYVPPSADWTYVPRPVVVGSPQWKARRAAASATRF